MSVSSVRPNTPHPARSIIGSAKFEQALSDIRARTGEFERQGHISPDVVELLRNAGVYRAAVLRRFGGDERKPTEILEIVEAIARADGSAGWVASFAPQAAVYMAVLPPHRLSEIYASTPDVVVAGGLFPVQPAQRVSDGLMLNGRWSFASGCMSADWLCVGISIEAGQDKLGQGMRMIVFPAASGRIVPNWDVLGLRGTGSHDVVLNDFVVAEDWSAPRGGPSLYSEPLYRFPALCFAALNHSVVALGIARAALDEVAAIVLNKASITGAARPADRVHVQLGLAKAEAKLRSARAFFYAQADDMWRIVLSESVPSEEDRALVRLAAANAAHVGASVVQEAYTLAGTTATRMSSPLQRQLRDVMMITQHAFVNEGNFENVGRVMLGLQPPPGFP